MKEFSFNVGLKGLNGLRAHHTNPRNGGGLVDCMNILPTENGLLSHEPVTSLFDDDYIYGVLPRVVWPFPQMHFGPVWTLLCFQTKIYSVDRSVTPWNHTLVYDFGSQPTWDEDNTWHIVDFHDMVVLYNGITVLRAEPYAPGIIFWAAYPATTTMPLLGTACNYRGQLIGGDFLSSWYDADSSFVGWGQIGNFDMSLDQSNIAGYMPMPFTGSVRRVVPLDSAIIVYGEGGIAALLPGETTFGLKKLADYGIMGRDAVYGDDKQHVFIDENGWLRTINSDLKINRLGYQEFFQPMEDEHPLILYDSNEHRYYISDGTAETSTFILTSAGLGKCGDVMPSGAFIEGEFVVNYLGYGLGDLQRRGSYILTTDTYDMNYRAQKTIEAIDVGGAHSSICYVSIDYRFKYSDAWSTTREVRCNDEGVAHLPCSGVEFRINLRIPNAVAATTNYTNIDYINVKYKSTDRRYTRGTTHAIKNAS